MTTSQNLDKFGYPNINYGDEFPSPWPHYAPFFRIDEGSWYYYNASSQSWIKGTGPMRISDGVTTVDPSDSIIFDGSFLTIADAGDGDVNVTFDETQIDHDNLQNLGNDTHTQYLKEKSQGGTAAEIPTHDHSAAGEAGTIDHGDTTGKSDDDHTQYLLADGTRALAGAWDMGNQSLTNVLADDDSNVIHAVTTNLLVRNDSGGTLSKGTPCYINGYNSGNNRATIAACDADNAALMPSSGLVEDSLGNNTNGHVVEAGIIEGTGSDNLDTDSWSIGDTLYVASGGGLTNTRPTGATQNVQAVAIVLRKHATLGVVMVVGAGRTNAVNNLHTHQSTGAEGGQLDHGLALTGLTDDDHSAYPLVTNFEVDRATIATNWTDLTDAGATSLHKHSHNSMDDLTTGDPHTQYAILAGREGGQSILGGSGSGNDLDLRSTSHGTKGEVLIGYYGSSNLLRVRDDITGGRVVTQSEGAAIPVNMTNNGASCVNRMQRDDAHGDGVEIASLDFYGQNDGPASHQFAKIAAQCVDNAAGNEDGSMTLACLDDGALDTILTLYGVGNYGAYSECQSVITRTTTQSINHNTVTAVDFSGTAGARTAWADTTNDYILPTVPGYYVMFASVEWASDAVGQRWMRIDVTGGTVLYGVGELRYVPIGTSEQTLGIMAYFDGSDDTAGLSVYQTSGGALNVTNVYISIAKVGF
jgi:hypothetical protein